MIGPLFQDDPTELEDELQEYEPDYCRVCDGTGEGRASDTRCGYCRGTGYERRRMEVEP